MSIYEYDEERHMKTVRSEGYDEGHESGYISGVRDGEAKGEAEGEEPIGRLCSRLVADGRADEIQKALEDSTYRSKLYEESGL